MTLRAFTDRLPNGTTVVTVEAPHLHSAMTAVSVRAGSRHETLATNGVSHMLEHLLFRGSARFPDSVQMNAAVEAVGGNLNAVTTRDATVFYTPSQPSGVPVVLRILGDMVSRPRLVKLATEKRVILEEMLDEVDVRGRDVDPDNLSRRLLYGKHPLALKIAGTPASVRRLTERVVRAHLRQYYVGSNLVVAVAGPVRRREVLRVARKAFVHLRKGKRAAELAPQLPRRGRVRFVRLEEAQVEFRLSWPAVSDRHPDAPAIDLLRRVLDDGLSSRLPYEIVERRGLAYSLGAFLEAFHDAGSFEIDGACAAENLGRVTREVLRTVRTLERGLITREELRRVKARFRLSYDFMRDSPADLCGWFGGNALFDRTERFEDWCARADALTVAELVDTARRYLSRGRLLAVAVGPRRAEKAFRAALEG